MTGFHLFNDFCPIGIVDHNIICRGEPFLARRLGSHDRFDLIRGQSAPSHDPLYLQAFRAVDDDNAVAALTVVSSLNQQRHGENDVWLGRGLAAFG